ncbi:MAG: molybdopterin molybdotransferase MoeA [Xanthomonadales bacterium]|nr:molybdopterin molybdotransferase MoeA [Xanthomonadales bacterium]
MAELISHAQALQRSLALASALPGQSVALAGAHGRIAAETVRAPFALPGFANSAMDGYAVRFADLVAGSTTPLPVVDQILAGDIRTRTLPPGTAMAIMTGATMPTGSDTVVIHERCQVGDAQVVIPAGVEAGANVRPADDDCSAGAVIVSQGEALDAGRLSLLAAFGLQSVQVHARPRVAVLVTGDELVPPGQPLIVGQRHDSNGLLLAALAAEAGADVVAVEHCGDDPAQLRACIVALAGRAEMLVTSGGVSAGVADHLPALIAELGRIAYWKVAMKPGMPVLCARIGTTVVFGLPGNPVSAGVTFQVLARPVLEAMLGRAASGLIQGHARLAQPWHKRHGRLEFLRCSVVIDGDGGLVAEPFGHQGSGALSVLAQADGLLVLPEGAHRFQAGTRLPLLAWRIGIGIGTAAGDTSKAATPG